MFSLILKIWRLAMLGATAGLTSLTWEDRSLTRSMPSASWMPVGAVTIRSASHCLGFPIISFLLLGPVSVWHTEDQPILLHQARHYLWWCSLWYRGKLWPWLKYNLTETYAWSYLFLFYKKYLQYIIGILWKWCWNYINMTSTWHRHDTDMTPTLHRHYSNMAQTWHRNDTDMTPTWHRHDINMTSTWHWHDIDIASTWHQHDIDMASTTSIWHWLDIDMTLTWHRHDKHNMT